MRLLLILAITTYLVFVAKNAFSQALPNYPNYSTAAVVPRAMANSLMSRGYTPQQVLNTMNGFATVAANDNANFTANATRLNAISGQRVGTWLGAASKVGGLAGGALGALQLGIAGYNYFYGTTGSSEENLGDGKPITSIALKGTEFSFLASHTSATTSSVVKPAEPQKTSNDPYLVGYQTDNFYCQGDTGARCAFGQAKLALIKELQGNNNLAIGIHITLLSYEQACGMSSLNVVCTIKASVEYLLSDGQTFPGEIQGSASAYPVYKYGANEPQLNYTCTSNSDPLYQKHCKGNPDNVQLPSQILVPANEIPFYIPNRLKEQRIDNNSGAQILNDYWKRAAQTPGYEGVPYPMNDPFTATDLANQPITLGDLAQPIAPMQTANWPWAPTVNPWTQPNPNFPAGQAPVFQPPTTTNPGTGTDPVTNPGTGTGGSTGGTTPSVNLPEPPDPVSPTIEQILDPLFGMFDSLKTFQIPINDAKCPTPKFTVFSKEVMIESHCKMLDDIKGPISNIFILFYTLVAFFIVFQA